MSLITPCFDVHLNKHEVPTDELRWRPAAYGIVIKDACVLLARGFGGKYGLPGGGVELGEHPEAGVLREIKEETGIDASLPRIVDAASSFFYSVYGNEKAYHSILLYYVCEYSGGQLSTDGFDEYEQEYAELAEWVPLERLDELEIAGTVDFRPYVQKAMGQAERK